MPDTSPVRQRKAQNHFAPANRIVETVGAVGCEHSVKFGSAEPIAASRDSGLRTLCDRYELSYPALSAADRVTQRPASLRHTGA